MLFVIERLLQRSPAWPLNRPLGGEAQRALTLREALEVLTRAHGLERVLLSTLERPEPRDEPARNPAVKPRSIAGGGLPARSDRDSLGHPGGAVTGPGRDAQNRLALAPCPVVHCLAAGAAQVSWASSFPPSASARLRSC